MFLQPHTVRAFDLLKTCGAQQASTPARTGLLTNLCTAAVAPMQTGSIGATVVAVLRVRRDGVRLRFIDLHWNVEDDMLDVFCRVPNAVRRSRLAEAGAHGSPDDFFISLFFGRHGGSRKEDVVSSFTAGLGLNTQTPPTSTFGPPQVYCSCVGKWQMSKRHVCILAKKSKILFGKRPLARMFCGALRGGYQLLYLPRRAFITRRTVHWNLVPSAASTRRQNHRNASKQL